MTVAVRVFSLCTDRTCARASFSHFFLKCHQIRKSLSSNNKLKENVLTCGGSEPQSRFRIRHVTFELRRGRCLSLRWVPERVPLGSLCMWPDPLWYLWAEAWERADDPKHHLYDGDSVLCAYACAWEGGLQVWLHGCTLSCDLMIHWSTAWSDVIRHHLMQHLINVPIFPIHVQREAHRHIWRAGDLCGLVTLL